MRLIGNKTRLLGEIESFLRDRGVSGGTFLDIFSGTASVARHFKSLGYRVLANDRLSACFSQAVAAVEVNRYPLFEGLREKYRKTLESRDFQEAFVRQAVLDLELDPVADRRPSSLSDSRPLAEVIRLLNFHAKPREGLIARNYAPSGPGRRMYFTDENARRIDGILHLLRENYQEESLPREELHLLISSLLDAADRVANISGTYGAFLKRWLVGPVT